MKRVKRKICKTFSIKFPQNYTVIKCQTCFRKTLWDFRDNCNRANKWQHDRKKCRWPIFFVSSCADLCLCLTWEVFCKNNIEWAETSCVCVNRPHWFQKGFLPAAEYNVTSQRDKVTEEVWKGVVLSKLLHVSGKGTMWSPNNRLCCFCWMIPYLGDCWFKKNKINVQKTTASRLASNKVSSLGCSCFLKLASC